MNTKHRKQQRFHRIKAERLRAASPTTIKRKSKNEVARAPKKGKTEKDRKNRTSTAQTLTAPLSALMDGPDFVPVRNVPLWVDRSAEMRRMEAKRQDGYIKRPLNAFMLYRYAYIDRARAWCLDNQQNNLSIIIGESWAMERDEVCSAYRQYATIEKANHRIAHPEYKFRPKRMNCHPRARSGTGFHGGDALAFKADQPIPTIEKAPICMPARWPTQPPTSTYNTATSKEPCWGPAPGVCSFCDYQWIATGVPQLPPWPPTHGLASTDFLQRMTQPYLSPSGATFSHPSPTKAKSMEPQPADISGNFLESVDISPTTTHAQAMTYSAVTSRYMTGDQQGDFYGRPGVSATCISGLEQRKVLTWCFGTEQDSSWMMGDSS